MLTVLLFVAMGDQDVGGLLQAQAEELRLLLAVLVDFKDLVFESRSVDVVFKEVDPVRLGNSFGTEQGRIQPMASRGPIVNYFDESSETSL